MIPGSANPLLLASAAGAAGYEIERSLRFNSSDSAYLSRTPASAGNRKTWTWAGWVKRSAGSYVPLLFARNPSLSGWQYFFLATINADKILIETGSHVVIYTEALYRDFSAWMHVVFAVDATQATATNRLRLYVNGLEVTSFSTDGRSNITQNVDGYINSTNAHRIGSSYSDTRFADGYLADIHFIDGQALDPTSFGEFDTNGVWQPIEYTGTYGTNGFHLPFSDNSTAAALGTDTSGAGNDWSVNNISVTAGSGNDSLVDTPTSYGTGNSGGDVRGNFATFNPLASAGTFTNGNLDLDVPLSSESSGLSTIGFPSSGKWYWETTVVTLGADSYIGISTGTSRTSLGSAYYTYRQAGGFSGIPAAGSTPSSGATYTNGDVIGIAYDADNATLAFYKNGSLQGTYTGIPANQYFALNYTYSTGTVGQRTINFGQRQWAYAAPAGFKALCTTNLPDPVVAQPSTVMDVKLYTGNSSTQTISGLGFSPDLVWLKRRDLATAHRLLDTVRGATKVLYSDFTAAETTESASLTAFNSDGFTLGSQGGTNSSAGTYVAWTWDAGSSTVTNTQGSITSQVRANPSAGFSIVSYTGDGAASATIGHGLNVAPQMIMVKNRDVADEGAVYHVGVDATSPQNYFLKLFSTSNGTAARSDVGAMWNDTAPTSSVFSVGTEDNVNASTEDYIAYCFAPVAGYSSGFSYTGNGSTDGSFVYLGFRPRLILLKCSSTTGNWTLVDTAREGYNVDNDPLYPNLSNAEGTTDLLDITSNGFKLRTTDASVNSSGATYIGFAWAELPFKTARAR